MDAKRRALIQTKLVNARKIVKTFQDGLKAEKAKNTETPDKKPKKETKNG